MFADPVDSSGNPGELMVSSRLRRLWRVSGAETIQPETVDLMREDVEKWGGLRSGTSTSGR
jgi:hypothetical protein